jgi:hypothetical protein
VCIIWKGKKTNTLNTKLEHPQLNHLNIIRPLVSSCSASVVFASYTYSGSGRERLVVHISIAESECNVWHRDWWDGWTSPRFVEACGTCETREREEWRGPPTTLRRSRVDNRPKCGGLQCQIGGRPKVACGLASPSTLTSACNPGPLTSTPSSPFLLNYMHTFLYFIITMIKQGYNSQFIVNMATRESITASRHISHCTFMQQTYVHVYAVKYAYCLYTGY